MKARGGIPPGLILLVALIGVFLGIVGVAQGKWPDPLAPLAVGVILLLLAWYQAKRLGRM
jgi:hypothetical protein